MGGETRTSHATAIDGRHGKAGHRKRDPSRGTPTQKGQEAACGQAFPGLEHWHSRDALRRHEVEHRGSHVVDQDLGSRAAAVTCDACQP